MGTQRDVEAISHGRPQRLEVLDSVRGVAAFVVVIHHCLLLLPAFSDYFFSTWRTSATSLFQAILFYTPARIVWDGYEAVTLFYVLSGLVLALPWVEGRPPAYRTFIIKRICRIWLPYLAAMGGAAVLAGCLMMRHPVPGFSRWFNEMGWSHPVTAGVLADQALMTGHYNFINGVFHSLIWEVRVSIIFPFLILPIVRWRLPGAGAALLALSGVIVVIRLLQFGTNTQLGLGESDTFLGGIVKTAYYAYYFVPGALIALYLRTVRSWLSRAPGVVRGGLLLAGLLVIQAHWSRVHIAQQVMVGVGSAMVIAAALSPGMIERVLSARPLRWLGKISYSLYLVHVPLLLTSVILLREVLPLWVIQVSVPPLALLLGWLFHSAIADPAVRVGQMLTASRAVARRLRPASVPVP